MTGTISVQEIRKDLIGFLDQINQGKTLTVIYRSRPYSAVGPGKTSDLPQPSAEGFLKAAAKARASGRGSIDPTKSFKEMYYEDMAKKYGLS